MANKSRADGDGNSPGRTIPLQVICPALSRNGTDSMRKALEILGIGRTFHGFRLGERPNDMETWIDLVDRKYPRSDDPKDVRPIPAAAFDRVIGDCGAVTDMPCAAFWRELMAAYPNAKVVLVERDVDAWFRSFQQTVVDGMMSAKGHIFANHWVAAFVGDRKIEMMFRVFFKYFQASNKQELAANAKRVYVEHNAATRKACQEEGRPFLDYKLGDGWQPLCDFLDVDVPKDVDFPSGNEAHILSELTHKIQWQRIFGLMTMILSRLAVATALSGGGWIIWKRPQLFVDWI